ncbi:hypothetical protein BISA_2351 [Bifidobacterium saguini DSM 23967]|uniref:Uncharacterized protein n=1 Tax=Bifidobacterium saguini DSM 23967 TaxID=1437607 RepID=A0A087D3S4_9BIFI|nr:hypothetical protein [Bifidobacterium saguini]KFI90174.1 hypothetical protein BISA_2351 [Bifidobacterium saguini DSM 23967]
MKNDTTRKTSLRFHSADGEYDIFARSDGGHSANEEHQPLYIIHRHRKGYLARNGCVTGVTIDRNGTRYEGFSLTEESLTLRLDGGDKPLPYDEAARLLAMALKPTQVKKPTQKEQNSF